MSTILTNKSPSNYGPLIAVLIVAIMIVVVAFAYHGGENANYESTVTDTLDAGTLEDIQQKANSGKNVTLTVNTSNGSVVLDNEAVKALGSSATLSISEVTKTEAMTAAVGDAPVYSVDFGPNTDFGSGTITVSVPYTLSPGENTNDIAVYYLDSSDAIAGCYHGTYANGKVTFTTNHLSNYAVTHADVASVIAEKFKGTAGVFGTFDTVEKISDGLYTVKSTIDYKSSPDNIVYICVGDKAASTYKEMSSKAKSMGELLGASPISVAVAGLPNVTLYKTDVTAHFIMSEMYLVMNIGDTTIYTFAGNDANSGITYLDGNITDSEISEFIVSLYKAIDSKDHTILASSVKSIANKFIENYGNGAYGTFAVSDSGEKSVSVKSDKGAITWTLSTSAAVQYNEAASKLNALVSSGKATLISYDGYKEITVVLSDNKLLFATYSNGIYLSNFTISNGSVDVGSGTSSNSVNEKETLTFINTALRTIGQSVYISSINNMNDVANAFIAAVSGYESFGNWTASENYTETSTYVEYRYVSGKGGEMYFQVHFTYEEDIQSAYSALAETVRSYNNTEGPMGNTYTTVTDTYGDIPFTAVVFHMGTLGAYRFAAYSGNVLINGTSFDVTKEANAKYLYVKATGTDAQVDLFGKYLADMVKAASIYGKSSAADVSACAKEFTKFDATKGSWAVEEGATSEEATLRLSYQNSNGAERYTQMFVKFDNNAEDTYNALCKKVDALVGTQFLKSTVYSAYSQDIEGITYKAVAYSGASMGGIRFAMMVGNIVIDGSITTESDYPYVYIDGGSETFDANVKLMLLALNTCMMGGTISGGDSEPTDEITGDDTPENVSALAVAELFKQNHSESDWSLAEGGTATSATLVYTVTKDDSSTMVMDVDLYRKADDAVYNSLSAKLNELVGTTVMGKTYEKIEFTHDGVSVNAVGVQMNNSYFLLFTMYCGNVLVDAVSNGNIYIPGSEVGNKAVTIIEEFSTALSDAASETIVPVDVPPGSISAADTIAADLVNALTTTGGAVEWSVDDGATADSAKLREVYSTRNGQKNLVTIGISKSDDICTEYAAQAAAVSALVGTGSYMATKPFMAFEGDEIDGVVYNAVYQESSGAFYVKFVMAAGDNLIAPQSDIVYIAKNSGDATTEWASIQQFLEAVASSITLVIPAGSIDDADTIAADLVNALTTTGGAVEWSVDDGATADSAKLREVYSTRNGQKNLVTIGISKSDDICTEYAAQAAAVSALVGTGSYMATKPFMAFEGDEIDGVVYNAVYQESSGAFYVKFVMAAGDNLIAPQSDIVYIAKNSGDATTEWASIQQFLEAVASAIKA